MHEFSLGALTNLIGDEALEPDAELTTFVADANTGRPIRRQAATRPETVDRALALACRAHQEGVWARLPPSERADRLEAVAAAMAPKLTRIAHADATTNGVLLPLANDLARIIPLAFRAAARALRGGALRRTLEGRHGAVEVHQLPLGPAVVLAPWNAPTPIAAHKIASALAAGCPVLLKPSEHSPHSCMAMGQAIVESGALPRGAFSLLHGGPEVGSQLVLDHRSKAVSFTGGLRGGRAVASACAVQLKPAQLELGGNNPLVVFSDANLEVAADGVVTALTTLNGQWCRALGRLIVDRRVLGDLMGAVLERLQRVRLGSSIDPTSTMGPLANAPQRARVERSLRVFAERGGVAHQATPVPASEGYFFAPTLVTGLPAAEATEEVFGPVATVHPFANEEEALELANGTPFGLAGYVIGGDERRDLAFARRVRAGSVKVGGVDLLSLSPAAPRPAWGRSGLGDEGVLETLAFFCGRRVVGLAQPEGGVH